jgi:hypothetical protein
MAPRTEYISWRDCTRLGKQREVDRFPGGTLEWQAERHPKDGNARM